MQGAFVYFGISALICVACIGVFLYVPWLKNEKEARDSKVDWSKARAAWAHNWKMCVGICINYTVSLAIFPGGLRCVGVLSVRSLTGSVPVTGLIVSIEPSLAMDGNGWLPVILILLFNVGDSCGRYATMQRRCGGGISLRL